MGITVDLRTAARERAGIAFSEEEYQMALSTARRKLKYINNMYGTNHSESYLATLIAEMVKAQWFTRYLNAVCDMREMVR